jgi:hypothetical protein
MEQLFITYQQGLDFHPEFDAAMDEAFAPTALALEPVDPVMTYCGL